MDGMESAAPVSDTGLESTESAPQEGGSQPAPKAAKPQAPTQPETFDVKVNGRVVKMTRQEVLDHASMSHAANSKFNEAKQQRMKADQIISKAKSNPIEALMDPELGLSKDQIRDAFEKWYHTEFIETEGMSPSERELKEAKKELEKYRAEQEEKRRRDEQEQLEQLTNKQKDYLQGQIIEALDASGLPKNKFIVSRMAFYMKQNMQNGWDAPMNLIVRQVKDEYRNLTSGVTSESSVDQLIELFGEDVINKIRRHDLEQLRAKRNMPSPSQGSYSNGQPEKKIYSSDVNKRLREMRTGKWI